jgi:hypothetical protein
MHSAQAVPIGKSAAINPPAASVNIFDRIAYFIVVTSLCNKRSLRHPEPAGP